MSFKVIGTIESEFGDLEIRTTRYIKGGAIAVELVTMGPDAEPFMTLSVNSPESALGPDEFWVKNWSENEPMIAPLLRSGLFEDTGIRADFGFAIGAPVWRILDPAHIPEPVKDGRRQKCYSA
jgi:hypothetical protein